MSKIFNSINRQFNSSSSSLINLFITTNSFIKKPNLQTTNTLLNFSRTSTSKHNLNFSFRRFCSISSPRTDCIVNYQASLSSEADGLKEEHLFTSIPVRAYYLSDRIDMERLMVENQANLVPHNTGTGRYAVLKFDHLTKSPAPLDLGAGISHSYMVVFPYGSVTMFNVHDHEIGRHLEIIKRHASGSPPEMLFCSGDLPVPRNYFDYEVREKPDLQTWMRGGPNYIMLQHLNIDGICTIGSVLGQSVALDYYCRLVDQLVNEYSGVNFRLEASGACKKGIKQAILLGEMEDIAIAIYRFRLPERSDIAWEEDDTKYSQMLDYLLDNFNLVERFEGLDRKFKIAELNNDFVVERMKLLLAKILGFVLYICLALIPWILERLST